MLIYELISKPSSASAPSKPVKPTTVTQPGQYILKTLHYSLTYCTLSAPRRKPARISLDDSEGDDEDEDPMDVSSQSYRGRPVTSNAQNGSESSSEDGWNADGIEDNLSEGNDDLTSLDSQQGLITEKYII